MSDVGQHAGVLADLTQTTSPERSPRSSGEGDKVVVEVFTPTGDVDVPGLKETLALNCERNSLHDLAANLRGVKKATNIGAKFTRLRTRPVQVQDVVIGAGVTLVAITVYDLVIAPKLDLSPILFGRENSGVKKK